MRVCAALVLAVAAGPHVCFSQSAPEAAAERQRQVIEAINQQQSTGGLYSEQLIGPLTVLALLYQEDGDRTLATAAIERARQIVRANYGLYSLEQAPQLQQLVRSAEERGDAETAWDLDQELLTLTRRHPHDLRTVSILREIADKRMEVLERYVAGEFPPQIVLGCYYAGYVAANEDGRQQSGPIRSCSAGRYGVVVGSMLAEAQSYYRKAIDILLQNGRDSSGEVRELEMEVLRNSYRYRDYRSRAYSDGGQLLRDLFTHESVSSASSLDRVSRLVEIADWDVIFADDHISSRDYWLVLEQYEQAYRQLQREGTERALIDEIFSPRIPVVLPTFLPNPLVSEDTSEPTGYIDAAFDVTKYGKSEHVEILDTTTNATRAAKKDLVRLIERSRFRPRVTDGQFADTSGVVVRYYLNN